MAGFEPEEDTQSLYEGTVTGFPYRFLETMRLRYFGGSTNHWAGNCRPLDAADFRERPMATLQRLAVYRAAS